MFRCSCAEVPPEPLPLTGRETGIEVGLKGVLITADGATVENPRQSRTAEKQRAKAQRCVSGRKQGRKRRKKAVKLLARQHQKVQRQRTDFHHKTALALLRPYDVLDRDDVRVSRRCAGIATMCGYRDDVRVANRVGNRHLAKRIRAAGWAAFRTILDGQAVDAGKRVVAVPPAYTSQDGSGVLADGSRCPQRVAKSLSVRTHGCPCCVCPCCGLVLDRDEHAAQNIRVAGQQRAGQARQASTWPGAARVA